MDKGNSLRGEGIEKQPYTESPPNTAEDVRISLKYLKVFPNHLSQHSHLPGPVQMWIVLHTSFLLINAGRRKEGGEVKIKQNNSHLYSINLEMQMFLQRKQNNNL